MKVVHTTRRNPEMEKYVEITPCVVDGEPNAQTVRLKVGVQSFTINYYSKDMHHAEWMRDMLCNALAKIVAECAVPLQPSTS